MEKMEASGWLSTCDTEEKKRDLLIKLRGKEDIQLHATKIEKNPGSKTIAKLMLNSICEKFSQRDNNDLNKICVWAKHFYDMCKLDAVEIYDIYAVKPKCMMVISTAQDDCNEGNFGSNIAVAAFTTAYARLKLLDMMEN